MVNGRSATIRCTSIRGGLAELHVADLGGTAFVHRHLTPTSILVGHLDQPLFTSFHWARGSGTATVANAWNLSPDIAPFVAPEVPASGLARADQRSDVFSLCVTVHPFQR